MKTLRLQELLTFFPHKFALEEEDVPHALTMWRPLILPPFATYPIFAQVTTSGEQKNHLVTFGLLFTPLPLGEIVQFY